MMDKLTMQVAQKIEEFYLKAKERQDIYNPMAWAIYQTWKIYNEKGKRNEIHSGDR